MGREFGHLMRMRHVITYSLSPFEQRAFPHYFSKGIPNVLRRTRACILRVAPRIWLPNTRIEFSKEKAEENDPILERGFPQAHWSLLLG
ncbi:cytochrome b-c1 complex subunit 8 isoform X1 [Lagenorhynchus albirostris]|uniref:cytochrome b-c1 complex subunit 8 isoform X1 n=1 Tax=Lagenorhynchus albirostris TaxID=27610 RepID=UPI0028EE7F9C|nr:cytochrome b-c1 complex subunit 8 isoform X1 [Lagenorhynchus albirostris]